MTKEQQLQLLGELANRFHQILGFVTAQRILGSERTLTPVMREHLVRQMDVKVDELAADGFEACVLALKELGDSTVTIFECNPTEEP